MQMTVPLTTFGSTPRAARPRLPDLRKGCGGKRAKLARSGWPVRRSDTAPDVCPVPAWSDMPCSSRKSGVQGPTRQEPSCDTSEVRCAEEAFWLVTPQPRSSAEVPAFPRRPAPRRCEQNEALPPGMPCAEETFRLVTPPRRPSAAVPAWPRRPAPRRRERNEVLPRWPCARRGRPRARGSGQTPRRPSCPANFQARTPTAAAAAAA
mmetsp:Transcript_60618/g.180530  ORF Transcript_60618/g.180530 Transcript_60618/m.180530 type:complete len:207 (-) Transcript_60618:346-966(-)